MNKKIIATLLFSIPTLTTISMMSSCSGPDIGEVSNFKVNTTEAEVDSKIYDLASFTSSKGIIENFTTHLVDENDQVYTKITLEIKVNLENKYTISTSNFLTSGILNVKIIISYKLVQIFKSELLSINVKESPYSYNDMGDWFDIADGSLTPKSSGAFGKEILAINGKFNGTPITRLQWRNYTMWNGITGKDIPKKIYINPRLEDYSGQSENGMTLDDYLFDLSALKNVSYIFIGKGVKNIGKGVFTSIGQDLVSGETNPCVFEFDIQNMDNFTISPEWFVGSCGSPPIIASVIIPVGANKTIWAGKLAIDESLIRNKQ